MIEYRSYKIDRRAASDRSVSGYACVFNSESRDLGFYETIAPGAIDEATIKKSDVFAVLNHDRDKVFARSKYGVGSLELKLDGHGLHYRFDAPNNDLGNSLLEYIDRGDIDESSFAFVVDKDYWEKRDGVKYRTILHISELFDVSPVWEAAYAGTEVAHRNMPSDYEAEMRSLDMCAEGAHVYDEVVKRSENKPDEENMDDKKIAELEEEVKALRAELEKVKEEAPEEEPKEEPKEEPEDEPNEEPEEPAAPEEEPAAPEEEPKEEHEEKECPAEDKKDDEIRSDNKNIFIKQMENKKYSLVEELRNSVRTGEKFSLTNIEERAMTVTDEGADVVATDVFDVLPALRAKNVVMQSGAKVFTGLDKKIKVPVMTAGNVAWASEVGDAADGSGSFGSIELEPHRLTAYFPLSIELLAMDSTNVEDIIRNDIVEAISDKLETTIFGTSYGDDQPNGLAYGVTETLVADFDDITYLEAGVEEANYENCKYIVSPKFKSAMRSTVKGANANAGFIWENGEIDGTPALSTGHVPAKHALYGDWSNLYIANFGDIEIETVRDSVNLKKGQVEVIVNSFWDFKPVRSNAFVCSYVA